MLNHYSKIRRKLTYYFYFLELNETKNEFQLIKVTI